MLEVLSCKYMQAQADNRLIRLLFILLKQKCILLLASIGLAVLIIKLLQSPSPT